MAKSRKSTVIKFHSSRTQAKVTDRASFNELTRLTFLINLLHKTALPKPLIIIIATKSDLERHRSISTDEARDLAHALNARYYEVSSKSQSHADIARIFKESADLLKLNLIRVSKLFPVTQYTQISPPSILATYRSVTFRIFCKNS